MAAGFRALGTLVASTTTPNTITLPAGHAENDRILLILGADSNTLTVFSATNYTIPTGYTVQSNTTPNPDFHLGLLTKAEGAAEADPSVAYSSGSGVGTFGFSANFTGIDATTPFDGVTFLTAAHSGVSEAVPTSVTSATNGALAVCVAFADQQRSMDLKVGSEQGFTQATDPSSSYETLTGSDAGFFLAYKTIATAGAITFPTIECNASSNLITASFVLKPAAGAQSNAPRSTSQSNRRRAA